MKLSVLEAGGTLIFAALTPQNIAIDAKPKKASIQDMVEIAQLLATTSGRFFAMISVAWKTC